MRFPAKWLPLIGAFVTAAAIVAILLRGAPPARPPRVETKGPPHVQDGAVDTHARQFGEDVADRAAGSQQELATASYILGHLQAAGYATRLEAVPVANAVRSTDVLALPPSGADEGVLVTVPFDTPEDAPGTGGKEIGLFLEVARALNVASPGHDVGFAALGAERTTRSGGHLGSRRLAQLMIDEGRHPVVVSIGHLSEDARLTVQGPPSIAGLMGEESVRARPLPDGDVFAAAGFPHAIVSGSTRRVGEVLLEMLPSFEGDDTP